MADAEVVKISVLNRHVQYGVRGCCSRCPVALAIIDSGYVRPYIGRNIEFLNKISSKVYSYRIPPEVAAFMMTFDRTGRGKPFTFHLTDGVPPHFHK